MRSSIIFLVVVALIVLIGMFFMGAGEVFCETTGLDKRNQAKEILLKVYEAQWDYFDVNGFFTADFGKLGGFESFHFGGKNLWGKSYLFQLFLFNDDFEFFCIARGDLVGDHIIDDELMISARGDVIQIKDGLTLPKKQKSFIGRIRYIQPTEETTASYVEPNFFYSLPGNIKVHSWGILYRKGKGYHGETNGEKFLSHGFNLKGQVQYKNTLLNRIGFGFSRQVPFLPKDIFLKLTLLPLWVDKEGHNSETCEIAYFVKINLPFELSLSSFGDLNFLHEDGVRWGYGEICFLRTIYKNLAVSYNPALNNQDKWYPEIEHRFTCQIDF